MSNKDYTVFLICLILHIAPLSARSDIKFSDDFVEGAKVLGIDLNNDKKQSALQIPKEPSKTPELSPPQPLLQLKTPDTTPKALPQSKIADTTQLQPIANPITQKPLESPKASPQPIKSSKVAKNPVIKKVHSKKIVPKKTALPSKKALPKTDGVYFASPEENIDNTGYDPKASDRRKIYNYDAEPPRYLIEQQNQNKPTNLPKFMTEQELSRLLFIAVNDEDINAIKGILQKGANINAQDKNNQYTPLMYAVKNDRVNSLRYLLVRGANPNITAANQMSVLHLAAILNKLKALKILLQSDADIFAEDENSKTFYDYIPKEHLSIVINDIYESSKNASDALLDFCVLGSLQGAMYSIENHANINAKDQNGDTPLILAVRHTHPKLVSYLLSMGADETIKDESGNTAFKIAQLNKYHEIRDIIETIKFNKQLHILGVAEKILPYKVNPSHATSPKK
jgi:ankyrin repeat protein